jgi:hypothetical protein
MTQRKTSDQPAEQVRLTATQRQHLARAARQLADLLIEAAPLAELLDSPATPSLYRTALRDLVGPERYFKLTNVLNAMCSLRAWEFTHVDEATRRKIPEPRIVGAVFDGEKLSFQQRGDQQ